MRLAEQTSSIDTPWRELLPLVGDRVLVLHGPAQDGPEAGLSGGDIDCAVDGLDAMWPLRLGDSWRLCQAIRYEWWGFCWVLERDGEFVSLDTLEDPVGLGMNGFPTAPFVREGPEATAPLRAAYLTAKRIRKGMGMGSPDEWARIGQLARQDPDRYVETLERIIGRRLAERLASGALDGKPPSPSALQRARARQFVRRFRTPGRALKAVVLGARRDFTRILRPTGMVVLISGPDGAGKSTLAADLPGFSHGVFRRDSRFHFRPGLLPRPGGVLGRALPDSSAPHSSAPHGRAMSTFLLVYYWLDNVIGHLLRIWPLRVRTGLVITERGWWDLAVDPRRYRLTVSPRLVRALGRMLPRPDVAILLEGDPDVLRARKPELDAQEIERQQNAWREVLPSSVTQLRIDAAHPRLDRSRDVREKLLEILEARAAARLGPGWTASPFQTTGGFTVPRGPRKVARAGLQIRQPVTIRGRLQWEAARIGASVGAMRLLPRSEAPPKAVRRIIADHIPPKGSVALWEANHPGRYVALLLEEDGARRSVAKIATDEAGYEALRREADAIESFGKLLVPPVAAPRIISQEKDMLLLDPVAWKPRLRSWRLDPDVAHSLGVFSANALRPAHGDFAAFNLLRTDDGWVLVDWESAFEDAPPLFDLCHYMVQSHALLGRPGLRTLLTGFSDHRTWVGRAIRAYMDGAGMQSTGSMHLLVRYLRVSRERYTGDDPQARFARGVRDRLLEEMR